MKKFHAIALLLLLTWTGLLMAAAPAYAVPVTDGLELWLDATDVSTLTTAGSEVTQWRDKSGNGHHANALSNGTKRPTLQMNGPGGLPTLALHRDQLNVAGGLPIASGQPRTIFLVFNWSAGGGGEIVGPSSGATIAAQPAASGGNEQLRVRYGGTQAFSPADTLAYGTRIVSVEGLPTGTRATADAAQIIDTTDKSFHYNLFGVGPDVAATQFGVGGTNFDGREFTGQLSEILIFDRILGGREFNNVGYYLEAKYSLDTAFVAPEPGSLLTVGGLAGLAMIAALRRKRRRR